jgi:hypothetical protein
MVELYLHSPIHFLGIVFNVLSTRTNLHFTAYGRVIQGAYTVHVRLMTHLRDCLVGIAKGYVQNNRGLIPGGGIQIDSGAHPESVPPYIFMASCLIN